MVEKTGKMGKSKKKVVNLLLHLQFQVFALSLIKNLAEGIIYEMEIQHPTYYTYHTLSCSNNSVKLEINEKASVVYPNTHYTINFYAYKTSLR